MKEILNKKEIEEIKELLVDKKTKIESTLNQIKNEHENLSSMQLSDEGDFAAASRDYRTDTHIKQQQLKELSAISHSLFKIENATFTGLCEMCDCEIGMDRLRVKPHAKYCIDCRSYLDKQNKSIA